MRLISVFLIVCSCIGCRIEEQPIDLAIVDSISRAALIIDVRTAEEFSRSHFPGAINIPHENILQGLIGRNIDPNDEVILYCRSGNRSGQAEEALRAGGFLKAKNAGGLEALLVATGSQPAIPD